MQAYTGDDFKELRLKYKATPTEWAKLLGVKRERVYQIEALAELSEGWKVAFVLIRDNGLSALYAEKRIHEKLKDENT